MELSVEERQVAWQPLTPKGVALFAQAPLGRLLLAQLVVALVVASVMLWAFSVCWSPMISQALSRLPPQGEMRSGLLVWHSESPVMLAENRFLSIAVDLKHGGTVHSLAHVQVEFGRAHARVVSLLGYLPVGYPQRYIVAFNRAELEPWWNAWKPALFLAAGCAVTAGMVASWAVVASCYCCIGWLAGFFGSRKLPLSASWRLAGAALLPGALFMSAAIVLYGLGVLGLLQLTLAFALHFVVGWIYLVVAPFQTPLLPGTLPRGKNPFSAPVADKSSK